MNNWLLILIDLLLYMSFISLMGLLYYFYAKKKILSLAKQEEEYEQTEIEKDNDD